MTKDEALKMAIEAMTSPNNLSFLMAITACKEALEQPAQEPVSLGDFDNMTKAECVDYIEYLRKEIDLLRFKEWQGLSDDEIDDVKTKAIMGANGMSVEQLLGLIVSLTEQALKEKNHAV